MEAVMEASKIISNIFSCISRGIAFTVIIFLTAQYFKKSSKHKSAYYVILNAGYVMDLILFINWLIPFQSNFYMFMIVTLEWYAVYFATIWNVVLCLNRCTALVFLIRYEKIWTRFTMFFVLIFMLIFPFAVDGYSLFASKCTVTNFMACLNFRKQYYLNGTIVNGVLNGIAIILIGTSMYICSRDVFKTNSTRAKAEYRLIYQAIFSSTFQLISFALKFASASTNKDLNWFLTFMYCSNIVWHFHHLTVMGTHFILSTSFRIAYLRFYHLKFLLPKKNHLSVRNLNTNVSTSPVSAIIIM